MNNHKSLTGLAILTMFTQLHGASPLNSQATEWRADNRIIDLHLHINYSEEHLKRAVEIMDAAGIGVGVNLSGGTVTHGDNDEASAFERNQALAEESFPGRFLHYMNLDYSGWDEPDFSERAVRQIEEGHRLGAAGLKEYKRLGLYLRDSRGELIKVDDPRLDPVWKRCGELGMPVSIHVGDPKAFWEPFNSDNERWEELKDHRNWWFGDPEVYPPRMELLEALNRVIERHPETTFVGVHFANNPEDIEWVGRMMDRYPNLHADLAARIPEIGRVDPRKVHDFFVKYQDRILFATDFMVYDRMILGSSGSGPAPSNEDAIEFYQKHYRYLETWDEDWEHMTPIQGDWTISSIGLPAEVLRKVYFDNARKLLARSLPKPRMEVRRLEGEIQLDGQLNESVWLDVKPAIMDQQSLTGLVRPDLSTNVRALYSSDSLFLFFESPFTELTVFDPPQMDRERIGLWERDVVEAFIAPDPNRPDHYFEFEIAPTNERLDLSVAPEKKDFEWNSGFESAVFVDRDKKIWTAELRIPLNALNEEVVQPGSEWRINLFRCDRANNGFLAWSPTLTGTFHSPERFGTLKFRQLRTY